MAADEQLPSGIFNKPFPPLPHPDIPMDTLALQRSVRAGLEASWETREVLSELRESLNAFDMLRVQIYPPSLNQVAFILGKPAGEVEADESLTPQIWTSSTGDEDTDKITVTEGRIIWNWDENTFSGSVWPRDGDHNNVEAILDGTGGTAVEGEMEFTGSELWLIIVVATTGKVTEAYYATSATSEVEYDAVTTGYYPYKLAEISGGEFTRYWRGGPWTYSTAMISGYASLTP